MRLNGYIYVAASGIVSVGLAWLIATLTVSSVETDTIHRIDTAFHAAGID